MDTIRHSEEEQAEMLRWHIESVVRGGLAGTIIYAWTDEWFRGGQEITDWAFGLVHRDRTPKLSYSTVKELFASDGSMTRKVRLPTLSKGFRDCLLLQWRENPRSVPRIAATHSNIPITK